LFRGPRSDQEAGGVLPATALAKALKKKTAASTMPSRGANSILASKLGSSFNTILATMQITPSTQLTPSPQW
jgi:hypothetical protein